MSPIILPSPAVTAPIAPIVIKIPTAKRLDMIKARVVEMRPCPSINPTIKGILARWHGLSSMLKIPHVKAAVRAIAGVPSTACVSVVKSFSIRYQTTNARKY